MSRIVALSLDELTDLLKRVFSQAGAPAGVAAALAKSCAVCERDGSISHGIFRVPAYISIIRSRSINLDAVPELVEVAPGVLRVDAFGGLAQVAMACGRERFREKIRENGIAVLCIRDAHHVSALWPDVEPLAEEGFVALTMVNCFACSVPFDGKEPVFGTNPFAMSAPCEGGPPVTFDMATTVISHGDLQIAAREGRPVSEETGVDATGRPTTDPRAILEGGHLRPFGGNKGSSISMMVELLCAGLAGSAFSTEATDRFHHGVSPSITGQVVIAVDAMRASGSTFAARAQLLSRMLKDAGVSRLPGERRYENRQRALREGIPISEQDYENLKELSGR